MIQRLLYLVLMVAATCVSAADSFYINSINLDDIKPGATFDIEVSLRNEITYSAAQLDLQLSPGLQVVSDEEGYLCWLAHRTTANHVLSAFGQQDGSLRLFITTQNARTISGNDGVLFTVSLMALQNFGKRESITLHHCIAVEEDATKHVLDDVIVNLYDTNSAFDVNGDGGVNVGDVNYVLNLILQELYETTADVNNDNAVNVGDVNTILAHILTQ